MTESEKILINDTFECIEGILQVSKDMPTDAGKQLVSDCCINIKNYIVKMVGQSEGYLTKINEKDAKIAQLDKQRLLGVKAEDRIHVLNKQIEFLEAKIEYLEEHNEKIEKSMEYARKIHIK